MEIASSSLGMKEGAEVPWSRPGLNMVSMWSQFKTEQKTIDFTQSKNCAKLMKYKRKVLEISGSYGWT
jgi:hypothetical protein